MEENGGPGSKVWEGEQRERRGGETLWRGMGERRSGEKTEKKAERRE